MVTRTRALARFGPLRIGAAVVGVSAIGVLSGCAPAATTGGSSSSSSSGGGSASSPGASGGAAGDGTYTETGDYRTPGGPESITVTLGVRGGVVSSVKTASSESTPNGRRYQQAFKQAVPGVVVGKKLDGLEVGAIAGSSLTPKGFNAALDKIRADAA